MSQDTNVENLIINKLTKAQYESITNPDPTQLYFITDEGESISTLDDVSLNNIANGQILKYNATTQKWENSTIGGGTWGNITGTLSDQTDLQTALDAKQNTISDLSTIRSGASLGATALQPNDNITELVNNAGYITGITSSDVTTALGYTPYNSTNPSGYITSADLPTVDQIFDGTSANAQSGVAIAGAKFIQNTASGTNSLTIGGSSNAGIYGLNVGYYSQATTNSTAIGTTTTASYSYSTALGTEAQATAYSAIQIGKGTNSTQNTLNVGFSHANTNYQLLDGTTGLIPDARISTNIARTSGIPTSISDLTDDTSTYPIDKAESVVDNNSGSLTFWSGTKAQYDAIATKDANTLYNITDDSNPTLSMLELLYPVGSIYIGTMSACPLQTLGVGTWQLVATDRVLQGAGTRGSVGNTLNESLPNVTGRAQTAPGRSSFIADGVFQYFTTQNATNVYTNGAAQTNTQYGISFDASRSSSTYQDNAPVQQDAYLVNIWERVS